jgi:hypothetical protein
MEYIPQSHKLDQDPRRDTFAKHKLLTRGQEVMVEGCLERTVMAV